MLIKNNNIYLCAQVNESQHPLTTIRDILLRPFYLSIDLELLQLLDGTG